MKSGEMDRDRIGIKRLIFEGKTMKRYLMSIIMAILILTSGLLAGCAQQAEFENRIIILETGLTIAESTNKKLQGRIEQLEENELTATTIFQKLQGNGFWGSIGPVPLTPMGRAAVYIKFEELR